MNVRLIDVTLLSMYLHRYRYAAKNKKCVAGKHNFKLVYTDKYIYLYIDRYTCMYMYICRI